MRKKILQFGRKHGTFMWLLEDKRTKEIENVYVQFSLKDPW